MKNYLKFTLFLVFVAINFASIQAQNGNIAGTISDENGLSVPGATVLISSLKKGTTSDFDGHFSLVEIPVGTYKLSITYLGYASVDQEITIADGSTTSIEVNQKV